MFMNEPSHSFVSQTRALASRHSAIKHPTRLFWQGDVAPSVHGGPREAQNSLPNDKYYLCESKCSLTGRGYWMSALDGVPESVANLARLS